MRGLAQELLFADLELTREGIESCRVGCRERRNSRAAIAVGPTHLMDALTRYFHEIAQEVLIGGRQIHTRISPHDPPDAREKRPVLKIGKSEEPQFFRPRVTSSDKPNR